MSYSSQQTVFSERQYLRTTDNKVVRHTDINKLERLHQTLRDGLICLAGEVSPEVRLCASITAAALKQGV
jgi:hypothetical protein